MEMIRQALFDFLSALRQLCVRVVVFVLVVLRCFTVLLTQMFKLLAAIWIVIEKLTVTALVVIATLNAAVMVWRAYGSDLPALILSVLLIIVMCALGLEGKSWGTLLAGGLVALAIGATIGLADIVTRSLIVTGALATTIAQTQFNRYKESDENGN